MKKKCLFWEEERFSLPPSMLITIQAVRELKWVSL
jgi:hypothetical protein